MQFKYIKRYEYSSDTEYNKKYNKVYTANVEFLVVNFYGMDDLYVFLTQINCLTLRRCVRSLRDIFKLKFLP